MLSERRAARRASDKFKFAKAIRSDNISQLGEYLEDTIGALKITDYANDTTVKRRIDEYLDHIIDFLNRDIAAAEVAVSSQIVGMERLKQSDFAHQVTSDIDRGEVWNSLAKLRRHIEQILRDLARTQNVEVGRRSGVAHLIERLQQAEALDFLTAQELLQVVGIANRAIHGEDVPSEEARQAVSIGLSAVSRIASGRAR